MLAVLNWCCARGGKLSGVAAAASAPNLGFHLFLCLSLRLKPDPRGECVGGELAPEASGNKHSGACCAHLSSIKRLRADVALLGVAPVGLGL